MNEPFYRIVYSVPIGSCLIRIHLYLISQYGIIETMAGPKFKLPNFIIITWFDGAGPNYDPELKK